ncbi:RNA ligase-domain-containing protein [Mycena maculata]|uniref:tRNA ligase n=1 Tax=Mycena maculata TaxID=230809 RepID=A0AAD7MUU3_9AGAR|nr:RNA ligase-domain-containing protein [Mycena maculata]
MEKSTSAEDSGLIKELVALSHKNGKLVRSSKYAAPADSRISVRSWKMQEHKYYVVPSPFPTLARGLFTVEQEDGEHRIVARGYDKFFNIGEVGWTTWPSLEAHTEAPYTLSLKSNGCIIFVAALTPDKLLITSKHAIGRTNEKKLSHAGAGEGWLRKYLAQKGRTEADLAAVLWERNLTAIAELCDDSFEEHVLAYPPELTGLHLHGLNERTKAFTTLPHAEVDAFAAEWGFIQTASIELPTVAAVRAFTTDVGKTGAWNGVPVEGFVVRTRVAPPPPGSAPSPRNAPPYPPGSSFFFKVKFDEPYMMYRDWREVTKALLSMRGANGKGTMSVGKLPKGKMRRAETQAYARWVVEEIRRDPAAFAEYNDNKGIVAVRERFLAYLASDKGKKAVGAFAAQGEGEQSAATAKEFGKTIIVPVAIPGCGKTAVAVALSHIFGFGHTQSDDVNAKKAAPVFIKNVTELLKTHDVVIADKNNHLQQHREQLRAATASFQPPVRLLALHWALDAAPPATIHRICADRVQARGTNHQTLRPDAQAAHEDVLWTFITKTEPLAPAEVDAVVDMELTDDLGAAVQRAVDACVRILGLPAPAPETVQAALEQARAYAPRVKKPDAPAPAGKKGKGAGAAVRYFALLPEVQLAPLLAPVLADVPFWRALQGAGRVAARPHVTLVHKRALEGDAPDAQAAAFWARCAGLHAMGAPPLFRFTLGSVVWNERVMAVTVEGVELAAEGGAGQAGAEFVSQLQEEVRRRLHITVGTRDAHVPPVEAKALVEAWRTGTATGVQSVELGRVVATGRVKGLQM